LSDGWWKGVVGLDDFLLELEVLGLLMGEGGGGGGRRRVDEEESRTLKRRRRW